MNTATKTEIDAAKTTSKKFVQKTAEATGGLIGNKIADKITLLGTSKNKEKEKMKQVKQNRFTFLRQRGSKKQMT